MEVSIPTLATVLPLALGGVTSYFKPFLEKQDDFKKRGRQMIVRQTESISIALVRLIREEIRSKDFDEIPRGVGTSSSPDYYADVSSSTSKLITIHIRTARRMFIYRGCYGLLLCGTLAAIALLIGSSLSWLPSILTLSISLSIAALEIIAVAILYTLTRRSEDDEEIS